jgi:membrane-associated protease RseP (regulator of RpoE activity)
VEQPDGGESVTARPRFGERRESGCTAENGSRTARRAALDLEDFDVDHYLEELPQLLDSAMAVPRYKDSGSGQRSVEGFEIGRIREASIVEQLCLRNGDVLLEVNGQPLDGLATVIQLLGQIQSMPQVTVTVLRNGQKVTFMFNRK